jgi:hypothetical protein
LYVASLVGVSYYALSNRFAVATFLGRDYMEQANQEFFRRMCVETMLSYARPIS